MWALVIDGTITDTTSRPRNLRRLDDGSQPLYWDGIDAETLAACGWFPVVDKPPTYDAATQTRERTGLEVVDGVPTVQYAVTGKTAEQLAAEATSAALASALESKRTSVAQAITWLRQQEQTAATLNVTSTNAVATLAGLVRNVGKFYGHFADFLEGFGFDDQGEG